MLSQPGLLGEGLISALDEMTDSGDPPWRTFPSLGFGVEIGRSGREGGGKEGRERELGLTYEASLFLT